MDSGTFSVPSPGTYAPAAGDPAPRLLVSQPSCDSSCSRRDEREGCGFRVAWAINPHMRIGEGDAEVAAWQHGAFVRHLRRVGASVVELPFVHGAFDSVFMKDAAILVQRDGQDRALLASPAHPQRTREQAPRRLALQRLGFDVSPALSTTLEGGDVLPLPGGGALLGHGFRSSTSSASGLERFLDGPVTPLRLVDPMLYHLDMAVSVIAPDTVLVCRSALSAESFAALSRRVSPEAIVEVSRQEALAFAVNTVVVGREVTLAAPQARLVTLLESRGFRVHATPLDQFHLAGGSAACLVSRVHDVSAEAAAERCSAA